MDRWAVGMRLYGGNCIWPVIVCRLNCCCCCCCSCFCCLPVHLCNSLLREETISIRER